MTDLAFMDATDQAALVRNGDATPVELVDAAIARVEAINPALNAVIHERFERAREEAADLPDGPFRGVPIVMKDLDGTLAREPLHWGNRLLKELGHTAERDSYLAAKLKAGGFVIIGKTNCPEFGLLPTSEPTAYGPTRNPWNTDHSPGGSSGGTGAAVASGMVPLGHGGDGGGSIRIPASMCGLFGLKPTRGRVSLGPDEGESWSGLVVRHVLTRTVRDSAAVLDLIAGAMPGDPYSAAPPARAFLDEVGAEPGSLRIGVVATVPNGMATVDDECAAAADGIAQLLESLGHSVESAFPAALADDGVIGPFLTLFDVAVGHDVATIARIAGREITADDVEALSWSYAERNRSLTTTDYVEALETIRAWSRRVATWWSDDGFDLLVTPTMAALPPPIGTVQGEDADGALIGALPFAVFTAPFNMTGQPAVSVPATWSASGLPIGTQLVAATGREDVLLRVAAQLEQARPWADRRPPVHG
jgi:amidase